MNVSSTFIENIFRSGLTLDSSNDIIIIKIDKKDQNFFFKSQGNKQTKRIIQNKNLGCHISYIVH